jgi:arsenate reductase-like glutaredoxin family protein
VQEVDINKEPPTRAFLEQHIEADHFLDYVSLRSPVFKERPVPRSKKEAIDLMMENANLIRRPILITGTTAVFGFDKDAYAKIKSGGSDRPPGSARRGR